MKMHLGRLILLVVFWTNSCADEISNRSAKSTRDSDETLDLSTPRDDALAKALENKKGTIEKYCKNVIKALKGSDIVANPAILDAMDINLACRTQQYGGPYKVYAKMGTPECHGPKHPHGYHAHADLYYADDYPDIDVKKGDPVLTDDPTKPRARIKATHVPCSEPPSSPRKVGKLPNQRGCRGGFIRVPQIAVGGKSCILTGCLKGSFWVEVVGTAMAWDQFTHELEADKLKRKSCRESINSAKLKIRSLMTKAKEIQDSIRIIVEAFEKKWSDRFRVALPKGKRFGGWVSTRCSASIPGPPFNDADWTFTPDPINKNKMLCEAGSYSIRLKCDSLGLNRDWLQSDHFGTPVVTIKDMVDDIHEFPQDLQDEFKKAAKELAEKVAELIRELLPILNDINRWNEVLTAAERDCCMGRLGGVGVTGNVARLCEACSSYTSPNYSHYFMLNDCDECGSCEGCSEGGSCNEKPLSVPFKNSRDAELNYEEVY